MPIHRQQLTITEERYFGPIENDGDDLVLERVFIWQPWVIMRDMKIDIFLICVCVCTCTYTRVSVAVALSRR